MVPVTLIRFIAFLTDYAVVDRIIDHLKLRFIVEGPPPPHIAYQEVLMAAEPQPANPKDPVPIL